MADSKITALTSIGTSTDPANDPLVIVDVSDTSMAASGTTKKVTLNNLLACSPTATLASATISGDLTVDTSTLKVDSTNNRVGIGTASPAAQLHILAPGTDTAVIRLAATGGRVFDIGSTAAGYGSANNLIIYDITGSAERFRIDSTGIFTFSNVGGVAGTAMTLNATGLGVGVASPSYKVHSVVTSGYAGAFKSSTGVAGGILCGNSVADLIVGVDASGNGRVTADTSKYLGLGSGGLNDRVILDTSGNVLVGTAAAGGSASNSAKSVAGFFSTVNGTTASTASGTAVTMFASPNEATFIVSAYIFGTGAPATYNAVAIVKVSGGVATVTTISSSTSMAISVSGLNVQATQTSGSAQVVVYSAIRIS